LNCKGERIAKMKFRDLTAEEIEVRVQSVRQNGAILLLYKTARTDMAILDETVGAENWQDKFYEVKGVMFCSIGINTNYNNPETADRWIWKSDAGTESNQDAEKGNASDARKRAGFVWGIGRELYTSPFIWIPKEKCNITEKKDKYGNTIYVCTDRFSIEKIAIENKKIVGISILNESIKAQEECRKRVFVWKQP